MSVTKRSGRLSCNTVTVGQRRRCQGAKQKAAASAPAWDAPTQQAALYTMIIFNHHCLYNCYHQDLMVVGVECRETGQLTHFCTLPPHFSRNWGEIAILQEVKQLRAFFYLLKFVLIWPFDLGQSTWSQIRCLEDLFTYFHHWLHI